MRKVADKITKLKQLTYQNGISMPMLYMKSDFVEKMEVESDKNTVYRKAIKQIDKLASKVLENVEDYASILQINDIYSEAYIFSKLQSILVVEKIKEEDYMTPDFKVNFRGNEIYIEHKNMNMVDGYIKHKEINKEARDPNNTIRVKVGDIEIDYKEIVIRPYAKENNKTYDPTSVKLVIESLIDKIIQKIHIDQFSLGNSILLVDFSDQLPLNSTPKQSILQKYTPKGCTSSASGELWHVAFGKLNQKIYKPASSMNNEEILSKQGILLDHPYIKGLIFHFHENFYYVAENSTENDDIYDCLEYISSCSTI